MTHSRDCLCVKEKKNLDQRKKAQERPIYEMFTRSSSKLPFTQTTKPYKNKLVFFDASRLKLNEMNQKYKTKVNVK